METTAYNAISIIIAILSLVGTSVFAIITLRSEAAENRKLHKLTIFSEYTKRYNDIMLHMPEEIFAQETKLTKETHKYARLYFNLCSEEFYLKEHGLIDAEIWNNWNDGIITRMKSPVMQAEWNSFREEEYDKKFRKYIDNIIAQTNNNQ